MSARTVLFVCSSLAPGGATRQVSHLAAACHRAGKFSARACVLGAEAPWAADLRRAGLLVHVLNRRRPFDVRPYLELRGLVRRSGAVVHVWGPEALRAVALTRAATPGRLLVSACLPPAGAPAWPERWLLRRARRVVALGEAEAARYIQLGVSRDRLAVLPPAVPEEGPKAPADLPGLPPGARVALGVGPLRQHKGFAEAVWALDMLALGGEELHLVLAGEGPDCERVAAFAKAIRIERQVHFAGPVADLAPWRARAMMAVVPSLKEGGRGAALEALAAGLPVVASRLPGLAELIEDGRTGLLVPPDDKVALATALRRLLRDEGLRARLGAAAKAAARERFGLRGLLERAEELYEAA
jgi:glycosyltransferase involved in cell wall biosynthesis